MRRTLAAGSILLAVLPLTARADEPPVVAGDLRSPESAEWHPESRSWFVSNMGGVTFDLGPDAGNGFLTRIHADGSVEPHWLEGLERPRGVSASATHVFVAEPGALAVVSIASGTILQRVAVPGSNDDLNDVVVDRATGHVFVSAPSVDAIFVVKQPLSVAAIAEVFAQDPALTQPNGLTLEPGFLITAGLGISNVSGLGGRVMRIDRLTGAIEAVTATGLGALDGIVKDGDDYLVTEYLTGNLYRVARDGTVLPEMKLLPGSADLGIDPQRRVIMVPETLANLTLTLPLL